MSVEPKINDAVTMVGNTAMNGDITVSGSSIGPCTETYSLIGNFIDKDTWQGTFKAEFNGLCMDCVSQEWVITGTRA